MVFQCNNGAEIICEESSYYFMVTIGRKTWYWNIDTGAFDGTGFLLEGI
jgi:hypothetical protein